MFKKNLRNLGFGVYWRVPVWIWLVCALIGQLLIANARADGFSAEVDRDTITYGENATLTVHFEGSEPQSGFTLPAIPNINVGGPSRNVQQTTVSINGNIQSTVNYTYGYVLAPQRPGNYNFPAMRAVLNGRTYLSQPFTLKVLDAGQAQPVVNGTFIKIVVPKSEVYVGEILPVELQIFFQSIRGLELPHFNEQGFMIGKMINPVQTGATTVNGRRYNIAVLKTYVIPVKTGKLDLGPATMQLSVPVENSQRDWFGNPVSYQTITLQSNPQSLNVSPLPAENVPASFNGAIGNFNMLLAASPTNIATGDPITIKVQITGQGALEPITLPKQTDWNDFKLYPPTSDFQSGDQLGISGTKTFSLTAVPETLAVKELPPFSFSFFDPEQKSYRTLTQPALPLIVRPSAASLSAPGQISNATAENAAASSQIAPLKQRPGTLVTSFQPLITQKWFLAVQGVPLCAWLALFVRRQQKERLAHNPRLRRQLAAEKSINSGMAALPRLGENGKAEEFFATVFRLLQERLGERLDLPASAITESVLEEHAGELKLSSESLESLRELFQNCNQARYARSANSSELVTLIPKIKAALADLKTNRA